MSGPNPPGPGREEADSGSGPVPEPGSPDDSGEIGEIAEIEAHDHTSETDAYSRAYSAPESEHFTSAPYVPADLRLYDYDDYDEPSGDDERRAPRWPWVVGVAAIVAAIALVVSVSLLVAGTDTSKLAAPGTSTTTTSAGPPVQDQITTTTPPPPPPPPTATETQTVTVTPSPPPPPPPAPAPSSAAPPPATSTAAAPPPPETTTPAAPRQVTYTVTGTKAPGDVITVTYVDASGRRRTQHNVYIPWSFTVTPISQSDVGSLEASSLFRVSRLNCSITTSDGTVLSSNNSDAPQTSC
jgi:Mycobacterium membrane protein